MNDNQRHKTFDYIMDKIYMPLSQAINESTKIYLAYPFVTKAKCYNDENNTLKCQYEGDYYIRELFATHSGNHGSHNYWKPFSIRVGQRNPSLREFRIALEVNSDRLLVSNFIHPTEYKNKIDMAELMFFNKNIDAINLLENYFIIGNRKDNDIYQNICGTFPDNNCIKKAGGIILAPPAIKKILYNNQEQEQFFKDFAQEIVKIYSESN